MIVKHIVRSLSAAALALIVGVAGFAQDKGPIDGPSVKLSKQLTGTWLVEVSDPEDPESGAIKVLFTFMPGRDNTEGTLIDTNEFEFTPDPICTPDQGVWQRVGDREFIATHQTFCFFTENNGEPTGPTKIRDSITLDASGNNFTGRQFIEAFNTDGSLDFSITLTMKGARMAAQAPPPQPAAFGFKLSNRKLRRYPR